jgi:hypothetical protein
MTSVGCEGSAGGYFSDLAPDLANYSPDHAGHIALEPQNTDTPRAALDEALRVNNALDKNLSVVKLDPRLYAIIPLRKLATSADRFGQIADRPDCDPATKEEADDMRQRLNARFYGATSSDIERYRNILGEWASAGDYVDSYGHYDAEDYTNSVALSAVLLNEQLPGQKIHKAIRDTERYDPDTEFVPHQNGAKTIREVITGIDTSLIVQLAEQRAAYAKAHTIPSLHERGQAFMQLLRDIDETQIAINTHGNLPIANAVARLVSAQAFHDLAMLSRFGSEQNRNIAIRTAVIDLWDAKQSIGQVPYPNTVTESTKKLIEDFLKKYSAEIDIDPSINPADAAFELSDEQINRVISDLGAAAHSAAHYHD